jgi:hypothetical protein
MLLVELKWGPGWREERRCRIEARKAEEEERKRCEVGERDGGAAEVEAVKGVDEKRRREEAAESSRDAEDGLGRAKESNGGEKV